MPENHNTSGTLIADVPSWRRSMASSIVSADSLARVLPVDASGVAQVTERYPMLISPHFLSLIESVDDPLGRQVIPSLKELDICGEDEDPLCEASQSPIPGLIHRYPSHVLFMVENRCAVYCRHCMRKRLVGGRGPQAKTNVEQGIEYIANTPAVREVVLSGGDPLMMDDGGLFSILERLRALPHVDVLRIHTRVPCALPSRITQDLVRGLAAFHPLYLNIQFNHPHEITPESVEACRLLVDHGIPLGSQTVLLAGVNDDAEVLQQLMNRLLSMRVRPYYLHQLDRVRGAVHFHVPLTKGIALMESLRGRISGMAVPGYVVDLPGGGGKAPVPASIEESRYGKTIIRNYQGKLYEYVGG